MKYKFWNQLEHWEKRQIQTQFIGWTEKELREGQYRYFGGYWHIKKPKPYVAPGINPLSDKLKNLKIK